MSRGISRAFVGMAAAVQSMLAGMDKAKTKAGHNLFSRFDVLSAQRYAQRNLAKLAGGGKASGKYMPHQGAKECARRVRQGVNGTCYRSMMEIVMDDNPTKLCACGRGMKLSTDRSCGLLRFWCEPCRRSVVTTAVTSERTRTQHGAGKKVTRWV